MPIIPSLATTVRSGQPYYRITSRDYLASNATHHKKVVNGEGALNSRFGARYNYPGVRTVYLAEDLATCFAERMFYFQRKALAELDVHHITGVFPPLQQELVLWDIRFRKDVPNVFESSVANASAMNLYPSLMLNPSQDYNHLKDRRAAIQSSGYQGLRAPSSRVRGSGRMVVLFQDHSQNVQKITPHDVEFRLLASAETSAPFTNHAVDLLDFNAGEVRVRLTYGPRGHHSVLAAYRDWTRIEFNH